ncbi:hypothetical protein PRZ48_009018 [Zasmidium cellare]|uniref:Ribosome biogenesis protein SLX9 n=1 Tax=Zasmidium cellare TaxID=395010 RepID=A0ABR0EHV9_ZASCE|nr:hypothetical protein PRZ48_009018 [Zasmidium cellare]
MAPVKPHRRTARAKIKSQLGKYAPPSPTTAPEDPLTPDTDAQDEFGFGVGLKLNKKDKRTVKHNTLLNRVREGGVAKSSTSTSKKRRRPGKKLVADLGGLGDALPEGISEDEEEEMRGRGVGGVKKMGMKSLRHRPGAMKRKSLLERGERERFGRNLAGLMAGSGKEEGADGQSNGGKAAAGNAQSDRWAALRGFIGATLETDRAFGGNRKQDKGDKKTEEAVIPKTLLRA